MPIHNGSRTLFVPTLKVDSVSISGVIQVGDSKAVFPHLDAFAQGAGRGAGSFFTQYFPRSRTRLHYADQTDVETNLDLNIVEPAPDAEQFSNIYDMYCITSEVMNRFRQDGNQFITSARRPVRLNQIDVKSILGSAVLHIGDTHYVAPIVHSISRGLLRGAVTAVGGPVGAI